jgi:hypothetical protein
MVSVKKTCAVNVVRHKNGVWKSLFASKYVKDVRLIFLGKNCENNNIKNIFWKKNCIKKLIRQKRCLIFFFEKLSFKGDGWQPGQKLFHFRPSNTPAVDRLCADGFAMNKDYLEIK